MICRWRLYTYSYTTHPPSASFSFLDDMIDLRLFRRPGMMESVGWDGIYGMGWDMEREGGFWNLDFGFWIVFCSYGGCKQQLATSEGEWQGLWQ